MTTLVPATPVPVGMGLATVSDHLTTVFGRPAPVPRRCDLTMQDWQPTNPTLALPGQNDTVDTTRADQIGTAAVANGLTGVVICYTYCSMAWAGGSGDGHMLPTDVLDYANGLRLLSKYMHDTYPSVRWWYERWNEPNQGFAGPVSKALRKKYIKLLQTSARACRKGRIEGRVGVLPHYSSGGDLWTGGTGAGPSVGSPFRHLDWHMAIVDADADCFDHISFHFYSGPCPLGTANGYDPMFNDAPPMRAYLDAHGRSDAQINSPEGGWFHRPDGTITDAGSPCYGYGEATGGNSNLTIEVTVTDAAALIRARGPKWRAMAPILGLGLDMLYQQDTTAPNNTDETIGGNPLAGFNHAGLHQFASARNGAATVDSLAAPALVDAFLDAISLDAVPPTAAFTSPAPSSTVTGTFEITAAVDDDVTPMDAVVAELWNDDTSTLIGVMPVENAGLPFGFNRLSQFTAADFADGPITFRLDAYDEAGNLTQDFLTITIDNAEDLPSITGLSVASGPAAGGTATIIDGDNLATVTAVSFGATPAASFLLDTPSAGRITAVSPAHAAGTVTVRVTNPAGISKRVPEARWTWTGGGGGGAPTVDNVDPAEGPLEGGTVTTLTGTGYA